MAPGGQGTSSAVADIEAHLKDIVQNLYNLIVQPIDHQGNATQDAMKREISSLVQNLVILSQKAPYAGIAIPPEVTNYVEQARNPDVFTREFVEALQRMNQMLKGRQNAYLLLRDKLAKDIISAIPELKEDVVRVVASTGDVLDT